MFNFKKFFGRFGRPDGKFVGRRRTHDIAFQFRMGAGFVGDVNRVHPASIEPALIDNTNPPLLFGVPVVINPANNGVRPLAAGDQGLADVYGVNVRPYPFQQRSGGDSSTLGGEAPPASGATDILRSGYILVKLQNAANQAAKGGQVFIWTAASAGQHVQGGFEAAAVGGNGIALPAGKYQFNGPADANGIVEIAWNV